MIHVTDHALVRYLERVKGFDFTKERGAIKALCRGMKSGTLKALGHKFEVVDECVITITPNSIRASDTKLALRRKAMAT